MASPLGGAHIVMDANSFRMTVVSIGGSKVQVAKAAAAALEAAGSVLHEAIVKNASRTDYTLQQLQDAGHPYAKRHGNILIHKRKPYVIHKQGRRPHSKSLHKNIRKKYYKTKREFHVWADTRRVPYAKYVIQGTRVMFGRDFLWNTMNDRKVKKRMMRTCVRVMGKQFRTKTTLRFD